MLRPRARCLGIAGLAAAMRSAAPLSAADDALSLHCWNGRHASGPTSALIQRQFCGVNGNDTVAYWNCNTDRNCIGYDGIRARIRAFTPYDDLKIGNEIRAKVCPKLSNTCPHPPKNACPI
jgi:hypothetical protein